MLKRILFLVLSISFIISAQSKKALTFDGFITLGRVTDPQLSPDGKRVAFVITSHSKVENKTNSNIYLIPSDGGEARQVTNAKGANNSPRWMPDGTSLAFLSTRDGESQIWLTSVEGGEAKKISTISTGASGLVVSPDGKWLAFNSEVYPQCADDAANQQMAEAAEKSTVKAKIFDKLPYRVWNYWKDGKRNHLFVISSSGSVARDLTPGEYDTPPIDLSGTWDYAFSTDSREIAFVRNPDKNIAYSTNNEIFVVPVTGGEIRRITNNPGCDAQPLYSPDGKFLAFTQMKRAGFEADRKHLVLFDRTASSMTNLTEKIDLSVNEVAWHPGGSALYFNTDDKSNESIFKYTIATKQCEPILSKGYNHSFHVSPDGKFIVLLKESISEPAEVYRVDSDGKNLRRLTSVNTAKLAGLTMNAKEDFWFEGAAKTKVHGFLVKPSTFDPSRKYSMVFLIHGGPQGQWGDQFHYRWNAQMFASRGNVVVLINPRGSTGYGQKFTDEISGDWGGKVYEDLMKGLDYVLKSCPFIDGKRVAAAGASYGGYMINWIAGHTDRFRCLVSHDGTFNMESMYGTTEELWFPEWEFKGTPYKAPQLYAKWSPHRFVKNFKTPTLVIHGQLDYRLDVSEGFQMFTALQRQGVKSKMLYFPDEGHFVAKPANAELWYRTVLDWIEENTR
ncbi:MAG: S9 family peptidase [bacterium]